MNLETMRERIPRINSWLLAGVFFCIPLQVAPAFWLSALMLLLWFVEGRYAARLRVLAAEPLVWLFAAYFGAYLLSMLWTEDVAWGWRMVGKQQFFLLFALYFSVARREHLGRYIAAFLLSIAMCEALAFYNWTQMHVWPGLPDGIRVDKGLEDTAPFVDRMMYTPALALAGYLAGHRVLFDTRTLRERLPYVLLFGTTALNLLISGGRAGLLGFLVLLTLLVFQRFARRPLLAAALAALLAGGIVLGGYQTGDYFRERVDRGVDELLHYEERPNSSIGLRIVYALNASRMIGEHPLLGVGIGDFRSEYEKINAIHTPLWGPIYNPHNQYLYAWANAGLAAGVLLLLVLGYPLLRRGPDDGRQRIRHALPMLFIPICFFESYLMRSNLSMMYVAFLAALWCGLREHRA
ncbi:MAG: O-antigen ligase family protein [Gammaproteobacteria bacterium]|nr:O-antigen ligase family protein [Gammaproteobacteria bacterium]MBU0771638.1 O-antigen ligase family protein [Gammaproteobacteria bacterium]MBU0856911.1 O-antigen ligase family protein [Gammaproteobacteria bacterium]MBU1848212.1 O-antigen ligase family protein [Gammaproteobacteria bacterium]